MVAMVLELQNNVRANAFVQWMDENDFSKEMAALALGKSIRMVQYYQEGREVPLDTIYLMEAISEGFRTPAMRHRKVA